MLCYSTMVHCVARLIGSELVLYSRVQSRYAMSRVVTGVEILTAWFELSMTKIQVEGGAVQLRWSWRDALRAASG